MFNKGTFCSPELVTFYKNFQGRKSQKKQNVPLLNILLGLSPLEMFVKCYKIKATKCTFAKHSSGIICLVILCKVLQTQGYKMYKNFQGRKSQKNVQQRYIL
jgi:hypothetical protein